MQTREVLNPNSTTAGKLILNEIQQLDIVRIRVRFVAPYQLLKRIVQVDGKSWLPGYGPQTSCHEETEAQEDGKEESHKQELAFTNCPTTAEESDEHYNKSNSDKYICTGRGGGDVGFKWSKMSGCTSHDAPHKCNKTDNPSDETECEKCIFNTFEASGDGDLSHGRILK